MIDCKIMKCFNLKIRGVVFFLSGALFFLILVPSRALADVISDGPLICPAAENQIVSYPVLGVSLGDSQSFFIDSSYDISGRTKTTAILRKIGSRAYYYVESNYWNGLSSVQQLALDTNIASLSDEFDAKIYPRLTSVFGSEPTPGIDGDERVIVLLSPMQDTAGGYFRYADGYPKTAGNDSNEKEMMYINVIHHSNPRFKGFLAHEFQHLITFNQKNKIRGENEDVWLNELRSELAPTLLGYDDVYDGSNLEARVKKFLSQPADPLLEWNNASSDYASVNLFGQYIVDRFGWDFIAKTIQSSEIGVASINDALTNQSGGVNFTGVFGDWTVANILNKPEADGGRYAYKNANLSSFLVSPTSSISGNVGFSFSASVKDWSPRYYKYSGGANTLRIDFVGDVGETDFYLPYIVTDIHGMTNVKKASLKASSGTVYIDGFGTETGEAIFIPSSRAKMIEGGGFKTFSFTVNSSYVEKRPIVNLAVSGFAPDWDFASGGKEITLTGSGFDGTTKVFFGSSEAQVKSASDNALTILSPAAPSGTFSVKATRGDGQEAIAPQNFIYYDDIAEGSLIRAEGDFKVYITKGDFRRHIIDARVFNFYGHLGFAVVRDLPAKIINSFRLSAWARADGDERVYEINGDATRHWLNMTAEEFSVSGRSWDAIYTINKAERNFYAPGPDVLFR